MLELETIVRQEGYYMENRVHILSLKSFPFFTSETRLLEWLGDGRSEIRCIWGAGGRGEHLTLGRCISY